MRYDDFESDTLPLNTIEWATNKPIVDSSFEYLDDDMRVYHTGDQDNQHFKFCVVRWCGGSANFDNVWDDPKPDVEVICAGNACFDGIRHLHMPYWHYVSCDAGIKLFQTLKALQQYYNVDEDA